MRITSRIFLSVLGIGLGSVLGCRPANPPQEHADLTPFVRSTTAPVDTGSRPPEFAKPEVVTPAAPGTAEALAQKAISYAQSLEPVAARRPMPSATAQSKSDWPDPDALRLTPQADPEPSLPNTGASAQPVELPGKKVTPANPTIAVSTSHTLMTQDENRATVQQTAAADDSLGARFATRARDYPADLAAQTDDQMIRFLHDEPVPNLSAMSGLAAEDREMLSALMDSLTNFRTQLRGDNNMLFSKKIRPLIELADRLHAQAELSVPTVSLCSSVQAFGVYEPIEPARFVAGKEQYAVVYCEVQNFLSQLNEKKLYETKLTEDIVLYNEASGAVMWSDKRSTYVDQARTRRHDFFLVRRIALPARLNIDRYLLKVTVEDQQARHIAENTVPVEIVAQ